MTGAILKWKRVPTGGQPSSRHGHRAVNIYDWMIVFGGGAGNKELDNELYVFNTKSCQWFVQPTKGEKPSGRAAHGFAVDGTRIFLFGGVSDQNRYSDELYELECKTWVWHKLYPEPPENGITPSPRLGHSFTMVADKIYLFGGLTNKSFDNFPSNNISIYLNDLYTLDVRRSIPKWDFPATFSECPSPRESHIGVAYTNNITKKKQLIIYGGMLHTRLGDLWMLDTNSMRWCRPIIKGIAPLPRSLHTATIIGQQMFVFGGWVPLAMDNLKEYSIEMGWECTNTLGCLNLEKMEWEEKRLDVTTGVPRARAGHCSVCINGRLYVWSGRDGFQIGWNNQVCCNDFWYLDVKPPEPASRITLVHASPYSFEFKWLEVPTAQFYLLEVQRLKSHLKVTALQEAPSSPTSPRFITLPISQIFTTNHEKTDDDSISNLGIYNESSVSNNEEWCTVGFFTQLSCLVHNYIDYEEWNSTNHMNGINIENIPDLSTKRRINLEPRTGYKFRLSAINEYGCGPSGDQIYCLTCLPDYPCAPSQFKISKFVGGIHLTWEKPLNIPTNLLEYSVYLVIKVPSSKIVLKHIYSGKRLKCTVSNAILNAAHIDYDYRGRPANIFRVWARNEKGYGSFTQVRFLQVPQEVEADTAVIMLNSAILINQVDS